MNRAPLGALVHAALPEMGIWARKKKSGPGPSEIG